MLKQVHCSVCSQTDLDIYVKENSNMKALIHSGFVKLNT